MLIPFFTVLAHGIARSFMVDLLGWRLAVSAMGKSARSPQFS